MGSNPVRVTSSAPPLRPSGGAFFPSPPGAPLAYLVGGSLLLAPCCAVLVAALGFAAGLPIGRFHLAAALGLTAVVALALGALDRTSPRRVLAALALGGAVLAGAALLAAACWDLSYDGQAYHQSGVSLLARGWNPLAGALPREATVHRLWLEHYLRGPELAAAVAVAATGSLEGGKVFAIALVAAAALLTGTALRLAGARPATAAAGAALAAANPVVLGQLATYYVDGQLALFFTCAVALASLALRSGPAREPPDRSERARREQREARRPSIAGGYVREEQRRDATRIDRRGDGRGFPPRPSRLGSAWPLLTAALALLAQVKFTGTVYAALLVAGLGAVALRAGPRARGAPWKVAAVGAAVLAATVAVGWQPLATNARDHGHPFFPLAGAHAIDVVSGQAPRFGARGPVGRFLLSTFSESSAGRDAAPVPKWPFVVRGGELEAMAVADVRVGGFGPLFALALVLCVAGVAWRALAAGARGPASPGLLIAAAVLATAAVNPAAWWARYVPQVWLAVVLAALALAAVPQAAARWLGVAALVTLGADAALVGASVAREQLRTQGAAVAQLRELARRGPVVEVEEGDMESLAARLATAGLRVRYRARCESSELLVGAYARACLPASTQTSADR